MTQISLQRYSVDSHIDDMMLASEHFEILFKLVNEKKFQKANDYLKESWHETSGVFTELIELAAMYRSHYVVQILLTRMRADRTQPLNFQKYVVDLLHKLDTNVERQLGCKYSSTALPIFTPSELDRTLDDYASARYKLKAGAKRLNLNIRRA